MARYLIEYGRPKLFVFHLYIEKNAGTSLQLCKV